MLHIPGFAELLEEGRTELGASVGRYCRWHTEQLYPTVSESVKNGLCRDVRHRDCDGPSGEAVHRGKEMLESVGGWKRDDVYVDVLEAAVGHFKVADGWNRVFCHL